MSAAGQVLLADIGGTNARFALMRDGAQAPVDNLKVADYPGLIEAMQAFVAKHGATTRAAAAVLGVAGAVENNRSLVMNSGWLIDGAALQTTFGFGSVHLLNDFEALAWSLPRLRGADLFSVGGGRRASDAPMLVIGPGTGFGAACLIMRDGAAFAVATEAGHATLPGASAREDAVIDRLRRQFGHASVERAVSGPGLELLYAAIASIDGIGVPRRDAAAITQAATDGTCDVCRLALDMFCSLLGTVAGNLALTFRARGGVYIAGGIVPRFPDYLQRSEFRARFEAKGRYRGYLQDVPTSIIMRPDATFLGLGAYLAAQTAS